MQNSRSRRRRRARQITRARPPRATPHPQTARTARRAPLQRASAGGWACPHSVSGLCSRVGRARGAPPPASVHQCVSSSVHQCTRGQARNPTCLSPPSAAGRHGAGARPAARPYPRRRPMGWCAAAPGTQRVRAPAGHGPGRPSLPPPRGRAASSTGPGSALARRAAGGSRCAAKNSWPRGGPQRARRAEATCARRGTPERALSHGKGGPSRVLPGPLNRGGQLRSN